MNSEIEFFNMITIFTNIGQSTAKFYDSCICFKHGVYIYIRWCDDIIKLVLYRTEKILNLATP